eukprot:674365-Hanusia_phi.AAC.1
MNGPGGDGAGPRVPKFRRSPSPEPLTRRVPESTVTVARQCHSGRTGVTRIRSRSPMDRPACRVRRGRAAGPY